MPDNTGTDTNTETTSPDSNADIIDQIDALTQDAATWTADENDAPQWNKPSDGAMTAVLFGMTGAQILEISSTDPIDDLTRLVGDPFFDRIRHLYGVQLWVGGNSVNTQPINIGATRFLHHLLSDVRDGDYIASDREREHARTLLEDPAGVPVIHGPLLITGVGADDDLPGELDENFQAWFTKVLDRIRDAVSHVVAHAVGHAAEALGIPVDQIGEAIEVVVVGLA